MTQQQILRPCVFLDRDGVVSQEKGYINHPERLELEPCAAHAIRKLNKSGVLAILVSNQAGVARGYFTIEVLAETMGRLERMLLQQGAQLDAIYFAPFHPSSKDPRWRDDPEQLRKPGLGMIRKAQAEHPIDMGRSYMVGDRINDIVFAHKAGIPGVFVKTGMGLGEFTYQRDEWETKPDRISENLDEAVDWILEDLSRKTMPLI